MIEALVLYEDQAGARPSAFGPHRLTMQCVADRLGRPAWELDRFVLGQPKKGNAQVRRACREERLYDASRIVIAFYDDDQVRRMLGLAADACKRDVASTLRAEAPVPERLHVVLLHRNMESLVRAVQACVGQGPSAERKPAPAERDNLLALATDPARRGERDCILKRVASFDYLVGKLVATLAARAA